MKFAVGNGLIRQNGWRKVLYYIGPNEFNENGKIARLVTGQFLPIEQIRAPKVLSYAA